MKTATDWIFKTIEIDSVLTTEEEYLKSPEYNKIWEPYKDLL